jgi:hypothetical protein
MLPFLKPPGHSSVLSCPHLAATENPARDATRHSTFAKHSASPFDFSFACVNSRLRRRFASQSILSD